MTKRHPLTILLCGWIVFAALILAFIACIETRPTPRPTPTIQVFMMTTTPEQTPTATVTPRLTILATPGPTSTPQLPIVLNPRSDTPTPMLRPAATETPVTPTETTVPSLAPVQIPR